MQYFASHQDAFAFWYVHAHEGLNLSSPVTVLSLELAVSSEAAASRVGYPALAGLRASLLPYLDGPLHVEDRGAEVRHALVPRDKPHRRKPHFWPHVWSAPVPPNSLRAIAPGVLVSSPEFTFFQLARELDPIDAALVGSCLCSRYRLVPRPGTDTTVIRECKPVTNVASIADFISGIHCAPGLSRARKVLDLVCENARSPMEIEMHALASWPKAVGGYGIEGLVLNRRINLQAEDSKISDRPNRQYVEVDLYHPIHHAGLEYDGAEHESTRREDGLRQNMLTSMREHVLHVWSDTMRNPAELDMVMRQLCRLCNIAAPKADAGWAVAHSQLRRRLEGPSRMRL